MRTYTPRKREKELKGILRIKKSKKKDRGIQVDKASFAIRKMYPF